MGRAECLPALLPARPSTSRRRAWSRVVVWPSADLLHPDAPVPDRPCSSAVCAQLDARRLVTTELYVVPPTYHQIAVSVGVHAQPGYSGKAVCNWVETVLRQYLSPLPPYGPAGSGWPLGRQVFGPELMAVALQVEGIDYLEPVQLAELDGTGNWQAVDPSQPVVAPALGGRAALVDHRRRRHAARSGPGRPRAAAAEHACCRSPSRWRQC